MHASPLTVTESTFARTVSTILWLNRSSQRSLNNMFLISAKNYKKLIFSKLLKLKSASSTDPVAVPIYTGSKKEKKRKEKKKQNSYF